MEMTYNGTLVMPKNFVVVDEEEMTYTNGGEHYQVFIPASVCGDLANYGVAASAAVLALCGPIPGGGIIAGVATGTAYAALTAYYALASKHNGMTLHVYTVGNTPVAWVPVINW